MIEEILGRLRRGRGGRGGKEEEEEMFINALDMKIADF